jgi:hypothetical protein
MRRLITLSFVTASFCFLAVPAFAITTTVTIDEFSNSQLTNPSGRITPGYVVLCEGAVSTGGLDCASGVGLSDMVVFTSNSATMHSDALQDGVSAPADTEFVVVDPSLPRRALTEPVNEDGLESISYTPSCPGDPGSLMVSVLCVSITYNITSDSPAPVPEPSTVLLLGSGVASVIVMWRRKRSDPA